MLFRSYRDNRGFRGGKQRPEIPEFIPWPNLEKLNKEKEFVGIYLSAHPLDEFKVAIDYGCNTKLEEFSNNLDALKSRDIILGGIVTGFFEGQTRTGNPYGKLKIEDYSGSYEIMLFGNDFIEYRKYGYNGMYLLISGKFQPSRFKENEFDFRIGKIELLSEVKDRLLESLTIILPLKIGRAHV